MTIIVFLIDTSASMNQKVYIGGRPSLLDVAKSTVETFVKVRQRSPESRGDRYMLLTFEEPPLNIKAGWKENLQTFMSELKNLEASGLTTLSQALRSTFDVLNVNRMQHGIDTYGQGRSPFYLEPSIIVVLTDGGKLSSNSGVSEEIKLQGSSPGAELTREPFRWDQRMFSLVLRLSAQPTSERETGLVPTDPSPIEAWCEVTGGRSYSITTQRMLHQCIDSLVQKVQAGVVIHFEKCGPDPVGWIEGKEEEDEGTKWHSVRRMIYVPRITQKTQGAYWPIPESFWPEPGLPSLPPRSAHPHVKFTCAAHEPLIVAEFPFDKYELEPSPLTQFILARKQPNICWQVFLPNSSKMSSLGQPFGYLKPSTTLTCVNLYVMPYNYPVLLPLLDELVRKYNFKPTNDWRTSFINYLSGMPPYYTGPLKRALHKIGAGMIGGIILEENYLSYTVLNYLKKLKSQAKIEYERTTAEVGQRVMARDHKSRAGFSVSGFKNAYDNPRPLLLDHLAKMRGHFYGKVKAPTEAALHNQPVSQMGNYQEYLKRMATPLREIEHTPLRQHMFGNPFKMDKRIVIDKIDEADFNDPVIETTSAVNNLKRKPGPIPQDFKFSPKKNRMSPSPMRLPFDDVEFMLPPSPISPIPLAHSDAMEVDEPPAVIVNNHVEPQAEQEPHPTVTPEVLPPRSPSPPPPPPPQEPEINVEEPKDFDEEEVLEKNFEIRVMIHNEIRKPFVRLDLMLEQLKGLIGSFETRVEFIRDLGKEAMRFRRQELAKVFQEEAERLLRGTPGEVSFSVANHAECIKY